MSGSDRAGALMFKMDVDVAGTAHRFSLSGGRSDPGYPPDSRKIPDIGFYCCVGQNGQYD